MTEIMAKAKALFNYKNSTDELSHRYCTRNWHIVIYHLDKQLSNQASVNITL